MTKKHYKHPYVNFLQTKVERRNKYHIALTLTGSSKLARKLRDYRPTKFYEAIIYTLTRGIK